MKLPDITILDEKNKLLHQRSKDVVFPMDKNDKEMLHDMLKYLEMSNNGNNNYILDNNNNYIIPGLNEEYDITKKYTDSYHNNSLNYGYYTENNIKNENENGNEKLHKVKDEYIDYLQVVVLCIFFLTLLEVDIKIYQ